MLAAREPRRAKPASRIEPKLAPSMIPAKSPPSQNSRGAVSEIQAGPCSFHRGLAASKRDSSTACPGASRKRKARDTSLRMTAAKQIQRPHTQNPRVGHPGLDFGNCSVEGEDLSLYESVSASPVLPFADTRSLIFIHCIQVLSATCSRVKVSPGRAKRRAASSAA